MPRQSESHVRARVAESQLTLDHWDARRTEDGKVSVVDVIAKVRSVTHDYAAQLYRRLLSEERVPNCEVRHRPPREHSMDGAQCIVHRIGRGGARVDRATPVATAAEMVDIVWQLPGTAAFRRNCAQLVVRFLGGDETLVDEIRRNRAAQEQLASSNPSHTARVFGEAVEAEAASSTELPEERAQKVRRLRLENDQLEAQIVTNIRRALTDAGEEIDDAQRWAYRDRLNNLLHGEPDSGQCKETTHASLYLAEKGFAAALVKKLRSIFGVLAARRKRASLGMPPNAELPNKIKEVDGHPAKVIVYEVPQDLAILDDAYRELLQSAEYAAAVGVSRQQPGQQPLRFARAGGDHF